MSRGFFICDLNVRPSEGLIKLEENSKVHAVEMGVDWGYFLLFNSL